MKIKTLGYNCLADGDSVRLILGFLDVKDILLINGSLNDDLTLKSMFLNKSIHSFHKSTHYSKPLENNEIRAEVNTDKLNKLSFEPLKDLYEFVRINGEIKVINSEISLPKAPNTGSEKNDKKPVNESFV